MNQSSHTIRLWGPWQVQAHWLDEKTEGHDSRLNFKSLEGFLAAPWSIEFARDFSGKLIFSRKFNCPTGLQQDQKVFLEVQGVDGNPTAEVWLNRTLKLGLLTALEPTAFDVQLAAGANQIQLVFEIAKGGLDFGFQVPPFQRLQIRIVDG